MIFPDFIQKLAAEVEDGESPVQGEERENLYPLLNQFYGSRDSWNKGRADKLKAIEASPLEINNV